MNRKIITIIGGGSLCALLIASAYSAWTVGSSLVSAYDHIVSARSNVLSGDIVFAREDISDARDALARLERGVRFFSFAQVIPAVRDNLYASERIIASGDALLNAADKSLTVASDVIRILYTPTGAALQSISASDKKKIVHTFFRELPTLTGVNANVSLALSSLGTVDDTKLIAPLAAIRREILDKGAALSRAFMLAGPFVERGPAVMGFGDAKTYLVLLQNNTEVRATGGFIGTYGILKMKDGEITMIKTDNVYNLDDHAPRTLKVRPPRPILEYFPPKERWWYLRDSNWSPDFADAAQAAAWFYEKEGGRENLDGVIALTPDVIASFLTLVGPVDVAGLRFTSENFVDELQFQVEKGYNRRGIPERERKEIVGEVLRHILDRMYGIRTDQFKSFLNLVERQLNEKHILLYFKNPSLQDLARSSHWSGEIRDVPGDYLLVVDSNMISAKTDPVIKKKIRYSVQQSAQGRLVSRVELSYQNNGRNSWKTTDYKDYVRVYAPEGATLLSVNGGETREGVLKKDGAIDSTSEHGKVSFGVFVKVPIGKTKTIEMEYELPQKISDQVDRGLYSFYLQKQSGLSQQEFDGSFEFHREIVRKGANELFTSSSPKKGALKTTLYTDQSFTLEF